jgi:hypothetical protein
VKATLTLLPSLALSLAALVSPAQTPDAKGCKDSPLISRFPGSVITDCKQSDDDAYDFYIPEKPKKHVEGKFLHISYRNPSTASKAQVARNITTALHFRGLHLRLRLGQLR